MYFRQAVQGNHGRSGVRARIRTLTRVCGWRLNRKKSFDATRNFGACHQEGAGLLDEGTSLEKLIYEGFAPHRVPVIVECLTDNINRTLSIFACYFARDSWGHQVPSRGTLTIRE